MDDRRARRPAAAGRRGGVKALVAVAGFCDPEAPCVPGELLLPVASCGRWNCTCGDLFHGAASCGTGALVRVRLLRGVPRALLEAELAAAMRRHDGYDGPAARAAALLDEVDAIEEGRLLRREDDLLLPFPAAARITRGGVEFDLEDPL